MLKRLDWIFLIMAIQQESKEDTKNFFEEHLDLLEKVYIVKSRLWGINNHPFNETSETRIRESISKKLDDIKDTPEMLREHTFYSNRFSQIIQYWTW